MAGKIKTYKVEYLFVVAAKEKILSTKKSFKHLLQTDDNIKITTQNIEYKKKTFKYQIQLDKEAKKIQNSFHLELECSKKADLIQFESLLKSVRTLIAKVSNTPPEILWNDVGIERANKAYPIINEIENLMRKLITKFMLVNVGQEWTKNTVPKKVTESIKNPGGNNQNYLHDVDFIQLSNFLFNEYTTEDSKKLIENLNTASKKDDLDLIELKKLIPKSNWERYFSDIVSCESESLEKDWGKLYELRCEVAHNKFLEKVEFEKIKQISDRLKTTLSEAIMKLNEVEVPEEQKENVRVDFANSYNKLMNSIFKLEQASFSSLAKLKIPDITALTRVGFAAEAERAIAVAKMANLGIATKINPALKATQMADIAAVAGIKPMTHFAKTMKDVIKENKD